MSLLRLIQLNQPAAREAKSAGRSTRLAVRLVGLEASRDCNPFFLDANGSTARTLTEYERNDRTLGRILASPPR